MAPRRAPPRPHRETTMGDKGPGSKSKDKKKKAVKKK
jgi:hypothetical protein